MTPKPLKVLMLSSSYPFHERDFHALFVHETAAALAQNGARVTVVTPGTPESNRDRGLVQWEGVRIKRFWYPGLNWRAWALTGGDGLWERLRSGPHRLLILPCFIIAFLLSAARMTRILKPDAVMAHWLVPTGLIAALLYWFLPLRILHLAHGSDVALLYRLPFGGLLARFLAKTGKVVVTSRYLREKLERKAPGLPVSRFQLGVRTWPRPQSTRENDSRTGLRLCFMGRLLEDKGVFRLLDVLERLPGASLTLAGEGRDKTRLLDIIAEKKLNAQVIAPVLGAAKARFFHDHDLFLFLPDPPPPKKYRDNLPVSVLEALVHGLPVVATPVGALPELLEEGRGGFMTSPDPETVAHQLAKLTLEDLAKMSCDARTLAQNFTWSHCIKQLQEMMKDP